MIDLVDSPNTIFSATRDRVQGGYDDVPFLHRHPRLGGRACPSSRRMDCRIKSGNDTVIVALCRLPRPAACRFSTPPSIYPSHVEAPS